MQENRIENEQPLSPTERVTGKDRKIEFAKHGNATETGPLMAGQGYSLILTVDPAKEQKNLD